MSVNKIGSSVSWKIYLTDGTKANITGDRAIHQLQVALTTVVISEHALAATEGKSELLKN